CTFPEDVLLLTGYWPVVGTSIAIATADGRISCLVPQDEMDLASLGWATDLRPYSPGSLETLITPVEAAREPLATLLNDLGVASGRIAYEDLDFYEGASYAAMYLFNTAITPLLHDAAPNAALVSSAPAIAQLRSRLTSYEVDRVRLACHIAGPSFIEQTKTIRAGAHEPEIAAAYAGSLLIGGLGNPSVSQSDAFVWCMSGPRSAEAGAAYARTANRQLQPGDLVLVHCNSYVDGYWTDITRTYCLGEPDDRQRAMYDAVFAARAAALDVIKPGARAAAVDTAARRVLTERGFGKYFTHGIGHSVGFSVISADFPPRLHPKSPDTLAVGSTFNIEPAIYVKGYGGIRHCDVVTVREDGPEVLTAFQASITDLVRPSL
ncbi:MAG TPA: Xaa-Pro peptidase family protein, partial [Chloroflexota bacterium]|nr:Xaa-Pro peptidase family protein [Chloroflexota bacterium]